MTRILPPFSYLSQELARKVNIRQWLSVAPRPSPPAFALAEFDASRKKNDLCYVLAWKALKKMTKFCHTSCNGCMAALLRLDLLCTCSTIIWLGMEE
jgi:hypothetical protein